MSNYATKNDAIGVDTSNLAAKCEFIALKTEVDKLEIKELVNVPIGLNNLKTKIGDLDIGKFKTVPLDLKKLIDVKKLLKTQNSTH